MAARVDVGSPHGSVRQFDGLTVTIDRGVDREAPLLIRTEPGLAAVRAEHRPETARTVRAVKTEQRAIPQGKEPRLEETDAQGHGLRPCAANVRRPCDVALGTGDEH